MSSKRIVIIGGVAGGMSCAARARRQSEEASIVVFERGPYPSFANCGLPYHIGGTIEDRSKLIVQSAEKLRSVHNLDVRTKTEVLSIDRAAKAVRARNLETGEEYDEAYDNLVISTGAEPLRPPIDGIDREGVFTLRNIPDMDKIIAWIDEKKAKRAVVGGGGYIGLEVAEQLRERGMKVDIAEFAPQVMAPMDPEMAAMLHAEIENQGIGLHLSNPIGSFEDSAGSAACCRVNLKSGTALEADIVILGLGVRPESRLASEAGLEVGERGGVKVDATLRTSDPDIFAVGDTIEVVNPVTGDKGMVALAGPANRQGRTVADNIFAKERGAAERTYNGTLGTAALKLFGLTAACTGSNETLLKRAGVAYKAVHLHPGHHVGYYPGAKPIAIKLIFSPETRKVLGAQAVGEEGVDKRIDVLAVALKAEMTVDQVADLELCYAPPYGGAKDPVNLAAMAAQNILDGMSDEAQWHELEGSDALLLDVREKDERDETMIPGSVHIPLAELRSRLGELPKDRKIIVHCASGQRSYYALRTLRQHGFSVRNLSGAIKTWLAAKKG